MHNNTARVLSCLPNLTLSGREFRVRLAVERREVNPGLMGAVPELEFNTIR